MKFATGRLLIGGTALIGIAAAAGYYGWQARNVKVTREALAKIDKDVKIGWSDIENDVSQLANTQIIGGIRIIQNPVVGIMDMAKPTMDDVVSGAEHFAKAGRDSAPTLSEAPSLVQALKIVRQIKHSDHGAAAESSLAMLTDLIAETSKEIQAAQRSPFTTTTAKASATGGDLAAQRLAGGLAVGIAVKEVAVKFVQLVADLKVQADLIAARSKLRVALHQADVAVARQHSNHLDLLLSKALKDQQEVLSKNGVPASDLVESILKNTNTPQANARTMRGLLILDPGLTTDELSTIPHINVDFLAAMQADRFIAQHLSADPRWGRYSTTHYPDGTWITAFGPCRGIDIPNPFTGGIIASSTAACKNGALSGSGLGGELSEGPSNNPNMLQFSTGPTESETIYVKGDQGSTGIGMFSYPVDANDNISLLGWRLLNSAGTLYVQDPISQRLNVQGHFNGVLAPGPSFRVAARASSGSYLVESDIIGSPRLSVQVRDGFITWVKTPHAVVDFRWSSALGDALSNTTLVIGNPKDETIVGEYTESLDGPESSMSIHIAPGEYTAVLAEGDYRSKKVRYRIPYGSRQFSINPKAGTRSSYDLEVGGFSVSTTSGRNLYYAITSSDGKYRVVENFPTRLDANHISGRVAVLFPGSYTLLWGEFDDMVMRHKFSGKQTFTVTAGHVEHLTISTN